MGRGGSDSVVDRGSIGREYEPRLEPLRRDLEQVLYSQLTLTALRRENSNTVSALWLGAPLSRS